MSKESYDFIKYTVYPTMSKVSLALATSVVFIMIGLTIYDAKLVNRVSLRLQTMISCYDIWLHSLPLWSRPYNNPESPLCTFIAFQTTFFPLLYSFFNVAIGINIQLIFLHEIKVNKKIEIAYWLGAISLSLIITIPFLAMGILGYDDFNGCYINTNDLKYDKMIHFYTNTLVIILSIIYLVILVTLALIKLNKGAVVLRRYQFYINPNDSLNTHSNFKLLVYRILLYPTIMIITHSGLVVSQTEFDLTGMGNLDLDGWAYIGGGMIGTLNFIAFCCDPSIPHAFRVIYSRIKRNGDHLVGQVTKINTSNAQSRNSLNNVENVIGDVEGGLNLPVEINSHSYLTLLASL